MGEEFISEDLDVYYIIGYLPYDHHSALSTLEVLVSQDEVEVNTDFTSK